MRALHQKFRRRYYVLRARKQVHDVFFLLSFFARKNWLSFHGLFERERRTSRTLQIT